MCNYVFSKQTNNKQTKLILIICSSFLFKVKCAVWYLERNEKTQREKLFDKGFFSVNMDKMITGITYLKVKIYFLDTLDYFSFLHEYKLEKVCIEHASILYLIFVSYL